MVFPLIKLGYLAIRQISKPLATKFKERAKTHPFFRKYGCIPIAQVYHKMEVVSKMKILGFGKPQTVPPLNEEQAVTLGADILGEVIVFGIACALVVAEYARSSVSANRKDKELMDKISSIEMKIAELNLTMERSRLEINEVDKLLHQSTVAKLKEKFLPGGREKNAETIVSADSPHSTPNPHII